ncbi:MAG TPA: EAL domain-containing protein, partial [Microthrixaceae bacterium]|nr:EAL domain-containing protein [Microthrixaceae bacterium]
SMRWISSGLVGSNFMLRVNLSARQLEDPRLIQDVSGILNATGFEPSRLCLEITETALMRDVEEALTILTALHDLGIEIAVDDFGTGYSSLSSLKRFPIKVLKIDRSFVDGLPRDPHDAAIVNTILSLAKNLGMVTTAEGVESPEQRDALIAMGCPTAQGYLFAKPQAAMHFEAMLAEQSACEEFA